MKEQTHLSSTKKIGGWAVKCIPVEEWMKRIWPCLTPSRMVLTEGAREAVSLHGKLSTRFFFSQTRDCTTFTLHDFYIESVTAHHINKLFMFSQQLAKFQNVTKIKTFLRARGPPGVSGALCSVRILRIGRIGSACWHKRFSVFRI